MINLPWNIPTVDVCQFAPAFLAKESAHADTRQQSCGIAGAMQNCDPPSTFFASGLVLSSN